MREKEKTILNNYLIIIIEQLVLVLKLDWLSFVPTVLIQSKDTGTFHWLYCCGVILDQNNCSEEVLKPERHLLTKVK